MVGSCTDMNGDGYVTIEECPANSFYRHLLSANAALWLGQYSRQYEISEVFHWHVTDADRQTPGVQGFPWADELPNYHGTPPFTAGAEVGQVTTDIAEGPGEGSGPVRFERTDDMDSVMFLGRQGETYYIETDGLPREVDTILEILWHLPGETVLASNDDCYRGTLRSCLTFSPSTTDYYIIRARPYPGSRVGRTATYEVRITPQADDYGDAIDRSAALVADATFLQAAFDYAGDVDVFKIPSSGNQVLTWLGCSGDPRFPVKVELLNDSGLVLAQGTHTSCSDPADSWSIGQGVYFLRASSPYSGTGSYQLKAATSLDIDVDSTAANAWVLDDGPATGKVIGTRFETGSDEDWYKLTSTQEGGLFVVETWGLGAGVDTVVEVYAPPETMYGRTGTPDSLPDTSGGQGLGHWMLQDDDGGLASKGSRLAFMTPVPGTYYIRVKMKPGSSPGRYYVAFSDVGWPWYPWAPYH